MSKFHSTVSRRDFMKGLGLAGAGLGAAAAASPVFHDLDEAIASSSSGLVKNPWWIKEKDFDNPTTEIDWNMYQRYDRRLFSTGDYLKLTNESLERVTGWYGTTDTTELNARWAQQGMKGMELRDQALDAAAGIGRFRVAGKSLTFLPQFNSAKTPEELGVPKWSGTPEENLLLMQVAGRYFGAHTIGVVELNPSTNQKFIHANDGARSPRDIIFEDIEPNEAYQDDTKKVIPNKCNYLITGIIRHPKQTMQTAPGRLGNASMGYAYLNMAHTYARFQEFLRGIGYQGLWSGDAGSSSFPVISGAGELGRGNLLITPQHGALVRKMDFIMTDLPIAPTKPIDAGIHKFCYNCKKCATHCPTESIPMDTEPSFSVHGPWNNPGIKAWKLNFPTCNPFKSRYGPGYCGICIATCPYSRHDEAWIHEAVAATMATTPLFNGFLATMDDVMGYGNNWRAHEKGDNYVEEWWNTLGPEFGLLTYEGSSPY